MSMIERVLEVKVLLILTTTTVVEEWMAVVVLLCPGLIACGPELPAMSLQVLSQSPRGPK